MVHGMQLNIHDVTSIRYERKSAYDDETIVWTHVNFELADGSVVKVVAFPDGKLPALVPINGEDS